MPVSLLKAVKCIINIFLTQFPPNIIQDKYSLWDFYTFSACLISQITLRKTRTSHLRCMWDTRGMCKLSSVDVYPLAKFICSPAFKLFHHPVWSDPTGSLGMAAAGVRVGPCCVDLREYLNGKRDSPSGSMFVP